MGSATLYDVQVIGRQWLNAQTFELRISRPAGFAFLPGQKIGFVYQDLVREYTLLGPVHSAELTFCVRHVPQGRVTPHLATAPPGTSIQVTEASGFFTFQPSPRPAVLVATGTGIAPYVAFVRSGLRGFDLLHGVRTVAELYYGSELAAVARRYIPCLTEGSLSGAPPQAYDGRVTDWLANGLANGVYDFYLCGRADMIRDAMRLIDDRFTGSHVFAETFYDGAL